MIGRRTTRGTVRVTHGPRHIRRGSIVAFVNDPGRRPYRVVKRCPPLPRHMRLVVSPMDGRPRTYPGAAQFAVEDERGRITVAFRWALERR